MKDIFEKIALLKNSQSSVLLRGETGSGKEIIAKVIHDRSLRRSQAFLAINCTSLPETLVESELFGSERGAFTGATTRRIGLFEAASGGTLFLDEIGDISLTVQAKLLRVLQEKEIKRVGGDRMIPVDVRIIAATNKDLEEAVKQKKFREDLYYRLNVITFFIPPLRDRKQDLEDLLAYFLKKFSSEMKKDVRYPDTNVLKKLKDYPWPGNVRVQRTLKVRTETEAIERALEQILFKADIKKWISNTSGKFPNL